MSEHNETFGIVVGTLLEKMLVTFERAVEAMEHTAESNDRIATAQEYSSGQTAQRYAWLAKIEERGVQRQEERHEKELEAMGLFIEERKGFAPQRKCQDDPGCPATGGLEALKVGQVWSGPTKVARIEEIDEGMVDYWVLTKATDICTDEYGSLLGVSEWIKLNKMCLRRP